MPYEKVSGPQAVQGENVSGVILPVGDGSIAIIGVEGERLERIEEQVPKQKVIVEPDTLIL